MPCRMVEHRVPIPIPRIDIRPLLDEVLAKIDISPNAMQDAEDRRYGYGVSELLKYLIAQGADLNLKDKSGKTALHYAARHGDGILCKNLIAKGAEVGGMSFECANEDICKLLLLHGAKEAMIAKRN